VLDGPNAGKTRRVRFSASLLSRPLVAFDLYHSGAIQSCSKWRRKAATRNSRPNGAPTCDWISTLAVVACAAVSYNYIEKPGRIILQELLSLSRGRPIDKEPAAPGGKCFFFSGAKQVVTTPAGSATPRPLAATLPAFHQKPTVKYPSATTARSADNVTRSRTCLANLKIGDAP
jgi:hypothetical protein